MACQSGLQPRTPLRHYVALFAPVGSMSLDFQVALLPYKSSSFATSRGRKTLRKYPWCHQCCMTESQSLLPLEEGVAVRRRMIAAFQRKAEVLKGPDVTHSVYHELSVFLRAPPSSIPVGQLKGRCLYLSRFPLRWQANVICRRAAATRKSRETLPTGANAAKRQRVYEVKNDNVAPLLLYAGPTLPDLAILCRMCTVVGDGCETAIFPPVSF